MCAEVHASMHCLENSMNPLSSVLERIVAVIRDQLLVNVKNTEKHRKKDGVHLQPGIITP